MNSTPKYFILLVCDNNIIKYCKVSLFHNNCDEKKQEISFFLNSLFIVHIMFNTFVSLRQIICDASKFGSTKTFLKCKFKEWVLSD